MNYLETIFHFLLRLAGVIRGRRKRKQSTENDHHHQPGRDRDRGAGDEGTGGDTDGRGGNNDPVGDDKGKKPAWTQAVNILGWCLMAGGSLACFLRN